MHCFLLKKIGEHVKDSLIKGKFDDESIEELSDVLYVLRWYYSKSVCHFLKESECIMRY